MRGEFAKTTLATFVTAAVLLLVWSQLTGPGGLPRTVLPGPMDVVGALHNGWVLGHLWPHAAFTVQAALTGLALGATAGIVVGAIVVMVPMLEAFVVPVVFGLQSVPKIAVAPLLIAWLGFGMASKVFTAALLCFFPVFVAAITGMRAVEPSLLDLYRSLSASRLHVLLHVRLPAAAPYLFAALQIAVVLGMIGSVVSEFVASTHGLGFIIRARSQDLDVSMMFAAILTLSVIGVLMGAVVRAVQRRVVFWTGV